MIDNYQHIMLDIERDFLTLSFKFVQIRKFLGRSLKLNLHITAITVSTLRPVSPLRNVVNVRTVSTFRRFPDVRRNMQIELA